VNGAIPSRARCREWWKAPRSTGCRQSSRTVGRAWVLVGPSRSCGARSRTGDRTDDNRCPLDAEEGNVVSMRKAHALIAETPKKRPPCSRTRPSLGPETRARQSSLNSSACDASRKQALWRGRFDIAVGQTCASRRNRHRGRDERTECGSPRVTASPRGKVVRDTSETEGGHGLRPCEETRAPVGVRTSWQLQKSAGRILAPNKLVRSAPKRVAVRVNGDLARPGHRRESVGGSVERNDRWRVGSPLAKGRDRLRPRTA
jgi:hypothetical protein